MSRRPSREKAFIALALVALCFATITLSTRQYANAKLRAEDAMTAHATVLAQSRRVQNLRARAELVDERARPEPDLVAELESALQAAGIRSSSLQQATASESSDIPSSPYARQRAAIAVQGVTPADALRFLAAWREAEPLWTPRSITMEHAPSNPRSGAEEERYTLRITLENIHLSPSTRVARSSS